MNISNVKALERKVEIPNKLIIDSNLNSRNKYLYIILKMYSIDNKSYLSYVNLMDKLKWRDKRNFKKYLNRLVENNYISNWNTRTRVYDDTPINVSFVKIGDNVSVDRKLIAKALDEDSGIKYREKGLIFLYFIESLHNNKKKYSSPSFRQIQDVLKMDSAKISEIIHYYHDNDICKYRKGWLNPENGQKIRNRYVVNQNNRLKIKEVKSEIGFEDFVIDNKKDLIPFTNEFKLLKDILKTSGLYFIYNEKKELIYIGKSGNVGNRIITSVRSENLQGEAYYINVKMLENKSDVNLYELYYISKFKPIYNREGKEEDDTTLELDDLDFTCGYVKIFDI